MASTRNIQDAAFSNTKAFAAAGATAVHTGFDLSSTTIGAAAEQVEAYVAFPTTTALVEAKTIIASFEDSANDSSWAAVTGMGSLTVTGGVGNGSAAASANFKIPSTCRRYLRATVTVLAGGGDNTALSSTFKLLF